jgi:hypothetical protein
MNWKTILATTVALLIANVVYDKVLKPTLKL